MKKKDVATKNDSFFDNFCAKLFEIVLGKSENFMLLKQIIFGETIHFLWKQIYVLFFVVRLVPNLEIYNQKVLKYFIL